VKNIGILLTKNESDIIEEMLSSCTRYFDLIVALDGSDDGTYEILARTPQVAFLARDTEISPDGKIRDGARGFLITYAQEHFGTGGWFTLLHGDEIFHTDPHSVTAMAEREGIDIVRWRMMNFFLHTSEAAQFDATDDPTKPIQERRRWYCPEWIEIRQFRNAPGVAFTPTAHASLLPQGLNRFKINQNFPVLKHYPIRTPAQARKRAMERVASGFAPHAQWILERDTVFRDRFKDYPIAKCYGGSFEEYEFTAAALDNLYPSLVAQVKQQYPALARMDERQQGTFIEKLLHERGMARV